MSQNLHEIMIQQHFTELEVGVDSQNFCSGLDDGHELNVGLSQAVLVPRIMDFCLYH